MAGRDERRDRDLDDWFDEPAPPPARRARPRQTRADADAPPPAQSTSEDWLGGDARPARRPRPGLPGLLSEPRLAIAAAIALVLLLVVGLALGGVFSSATPRRAATTIVSTHAANTTAPSTATQRASGTVAAPSIPLKPGDQGPAVKVLQRALASLGYPSGSVDGTYGPSTQSAVAQFQAASKLTPDGILGPQTLAALRAALKRH
jgi:hypothetical protein